jgi:hypothetical protein
MNLNDMVWDKMEWIHLVQDTEPVGGGGSCKHSNKLAGSIKMLGNY